jgi:hypothetical protein
MRNLKDQSLKVKIVSSIQVLVAEAEFDEVGLLFRINRISVGLVGNRS